MFFRKAYKSFVIKNTLVVILVSLSFLLSSSVFAAVNFVTKWGSNGSGNGQFNLPMGVVVDSSGKVYVGEYGNSRIQKFDANGNFDSIFISANISDPRDMAFTNDGTEFYVADTAYHQIRIFNSSGTYLRSKTGFNGPMAIAFDSSGNWYVADYYSNTVKKYNSSDNFVTSWSVTGPRGLDIDSNDYIYVTSGNTVKKYNTSGSLQTSWGSSGSGDGQFSSPEGLAVDNYNNVYVVDGGNSRVQKFNSSGTFLDKWGSSGSGDGQFTTPYCIAVNGEGLIYTTEYVGYRTQKFSDDTLVTNASPNVPSSLGGSSLVNGSATGDTTPTLTFTLSDSDSGDTVKYKIQIDDTSNFSSPVVDYTSALAAQGSLSFTVGQAAASGSYTTGSEGQTLTDASYYWRVLATDNSSDSSSYSTANSGSIAFKVDTTNPTTPGTPSTTSPTSDTTPSWTWTASTDAGGLHPTTPYSLQWSMDNTFSTGVQNTTVSTNSFTHSTELSEGTWYFKVKAVDTLSQESAFSSAGSVVIDTSESAISNIQTNPTNSQVEITWATNEQASSRVSYGLTSSIGSQTPQINTSPRVTDHSVTITGLKSCTRYYYKVTSIDASSNTANSSVSSFSTAGCTASSIVGGSESAITTSGGTFDLSLNNSTATITAPNSFYSENATMQINKLNTSSAPTAPSGKGMVDDNFFDLIAITDSNDVISSFDENVTFTVEYTSSIEQNFDETTLDVYKYQDGSWVAKECTLDTSANTLTCTLPSFSVYGVFGVPTQSSSSSSSSSQSSNKTPATKPYLNIVSIGQVSYSKDELYYFLSPIDNSSQIQIKGEGHPDKIVRIFINDEKPIEITVGSDGWWDYILHNPETGKEYKFDVYSKNRDGDKTKVFNFYITAK